MLRFLRGERKASIIGTTTAVVVATAVLLFVLDQRSIQTHFVQVVHGRCVDGLPGKQANRDGWAAMRDGWESQRVFLDRIEAIGHAAPAPTDPAIKRLLRQEFTAIRQAKANAERASDAASDAYAKSAVKPCKDLR